jgi:hypothetical protein
MSAAAIARRGLAHRLAAGLLVLAAAAPVAATAVDGTDAETADRAAQLTLYAWASGLDATLTPFTGAPTVRVQRSFGDLFEDNDAAFFATGYLRRDRLVLLGDLSYSASSKDGLVPPGVPGEGSLRQRSLTLAAGWRAVHGGRLSLDLLAGLRHWRVRGAVEVPLAGVDRSPTASFTDPLLAVRANIALAPRWSLIAYADVGVTGSGSDDTHQWLATVNYAPRSTWVVSAGLRQLRVDYRSGGTRLDATLAGPLLGATRRF